MYIDAPLLAWFQYTEVDGSRSTDRHACTPPLAAEHPAGAAAGKRRLGLRLVSQACPVP